MFRDLIEAFRRRPLLDQMYTEMEQMLAEGVNMFRPIAALLTGEAKLSRETHEMIYATDRRINHIQRNIRKQLVEHLTISTGADVSISLVLMSISKDAERIGDMCKNVLEVAEALGGPLENGRYGQRFRTLLAETEALFGPTVRAFCESDAEIGRDAVERGRKLAKDCEAIIEDLLEDDLPCRLAVLYTLLARHLKRICSHLSNVATSVVMPMHRLDYFDEKWDRPRNP
ncbi:MAG: phosphate uptake regulator PhoU [Candidatus Eisenbacteria bacterium]|nr:phosphate uptake regulator PhoU [Candidatus Eisenbacteria bacterium]